MTPEPSEKHGRGGRHRFLLGCERLSRRRYGWIFLGALILTALGTWLGSQLRIESDILNLIPPGNREVDAFKDAASRFGSTSYLVVLLEAEGSAGPDELEDFADALSGRLLASNDLVASIEFKLDPGADFLGLFYDNALLYLPPERMPELAQRLSDAGIVEQVARNRLRLSSPTAALDQELMTNDPLQLMPLFFRPTGALGNLRLDLTDGYYLARDGRALLMLVQPTASWEDLSFDRRLLGAVRDAETATRAALEAEGEKSGEPVAPVVARYTGRYAIAVDEAELIRSDIQRNLLLSLVAVSALYYLCYRRFAALLYSSVPLLVGQALTFGLAFFVLRSLNASSAAFTALLMGLGTDFVVVMYTRYVEERRLGRSLAEATELMVGETGLGVFTGAITSAGTFYAACISEFRGLRDLGFLIGSGILLCAVAIVFLVPAMISWNEGVRPRRGDVVRKLHVQSFWIERAITFSARHRRAVIGATVVATLCSAWLALGLEFDDTVQVLRSPHSSGFQAQEEVAQRFGASLSFMMAVVTGRTEDEALGLTETIEQRLAPWIQDGTVASYDSILGWIPPASRQRRVLELRDAQRGSTFDAARIRDTFARELEHNGFNREPFESFFGRLDRFLGVEQPIGLQNLERAGLGRLARRYVDRSDGAVRIVTYLSVSDPRWKREAPPGLVQALQNDDPRITVTGTNVVSKEFRRIFQREAPRAVLFGLLLVAVLLLLDFRSLSLTAVALAQLICGVVLMLGVMRVCGIHLNYVNSFVATMILGVGIDYGIHIVHRMSLTGGKLEPGLLETGKAVVIAALTNIAAFGTLMLGHYPALRSFGAVAAIGSATCLLTALTFVPATMIRPERR
jgi:uncharacterized protein